MTALKGAKNPALIWVRFRQYDPVNIRRMPSKPIEFNFSPRKIQPVKIIKTGVKARKGSVREGDHEMVSRGHHRGVGWRHETKNAGHKSKKGV